MRYYISELLIYLTNHWINTIPLHWFRLFWYRNVMKMQIGKRSTLLLGTTIDTRSSLSIGEKSTINENCRLDNRGTIHIGDCVSISAETILLTADHDIQNPSFSGRNRPIVIEDFVFIGTRSTILPGVKLGKGSVVAAGSVVTKDVEPFNIVGGVPAKVIGNRQSEMNYSPEYRRLFH